MNKVKRDYCSKDSHPQWRAWEAEYDMTTLAWSQIGCFCQYCKKEIGLNNVIGSGAPRENGYIRKYDQTRLSLNQRFKLNNHYAKNK